MTNKERVLILSIFISVFGFSLFNAVNPLESHMGNPSFVIASEYISKMPVVVEEETSDLRSEVDRQRTRFDSSKPKMVNMLSITLGMSVEDVQESLDGGVKPSEMLASSGILLSDLAEEFNFDIVGERGLVKFRA
ncbi:MAG: hypothetical protein RBS01_04180 [Candidatus Dojkabacteria bacterium]|jgi:hypothetical protein|nr:hypothetical protein [Candidatus Dojkabacteria bacterium]